jgi:hypothetical protein
MTHALTMYAWPPEVISSSKSGTPVSNPSESVSDLCLAACIAACCSSQVKRWFHYDDSHVRQLAGIQAVARACERDGYLFFYVNDAIAEC